MKIGIIIYSFTGNTKLVAERVAKRLVSDGHEVDLIFIEPNESIDLKAEEVVIKKIPDISRFDTLVLGTPVHGGRMSAPMRYFLNQIKTLEGSISFSL